MADFHGIPEEEFELWLHEVTRPRIRRPLRPEPLERRIKAARRCSVCHEFLSRGATEFVDGYEYHRACVRREFA